MFKRKTTFFSKKQESKQIDLEEPEKKIILQETPIPKESAVLHIYVRSFNDEVKILSASSNVKDQIKACQNIGHLIYYGGAVLEAHIRKETQGIDLILDILKKRDLHNSILWMVFSYSF